MIIVDSFTHKRNVFQFEQGYKITNERLYHHKTNTLTIIISLAWSGMVTVTVTKGIID